MITASGLTKHYGTATALGDFTFDLTAGIVTWLLGPNGAGKTTSIRLVPGMDRATTGRADRAKPAPMQEISVNVAYETPHALTTTGLDTSTLGAIAFAHGRPLDKMSTQMANLATACLEHTSHSVQYPADTRPARKPFIVTPLYRARAAERIS